MHYDFFSDPFLLPPLSISKFFELFSIVSFLLHPYNGIHIYKINQNFQSLKSKRGKEL